MARKKKAPKFRAGDWVEIDDLETPAGPRPAKVGNRVRESKVARSGSEKEYRFAPLNAWYPHTSLQYEDGPPVAAPAEISWDAPTFGSSMFIGLDPASPSPKDKLQKEIEERGLENWAHDHLDDIELVDRSDHGLLYSAYRLVRGILGPPSSMPENSFKFVVVRGNIGQTHWLWVPPFCNTAEQAVAWTFGMLPGEYSPISEA